VSEEKMVKVISKCPRCGKTDEFQIPDSGLQQRSKGVELHKAFPDLPEHRIQQLATHLCEACQLKGKP
jgi:phage FluMu protein Com